MNKPTKNRPALILGASPRVSVPMARALEQQGIPVDVASFQSDEPDLSSRAIQRFHRLPARRENPDESTQALLTLVRERQFDTILPAGDPALAALADLYDELSPLLRIGCPPPPSVERVLNKSLTLEAAQHCGIRVPFTCSVTSAAELELVAPDLRFPIVAKPEKKGAASFRVYYFRNLKDLSNALVANNWGRVLLQEYCPGVGVGIDVLIHRGECIAKFQHRRLKEAPATGGVAILAIAEEPDPKLLRSSVELLRTLEWDGVAMVEYRVGSENERPALMEVNGRFWGSVSFPIAAGINFPYYYWQVLHGQQPAVPERYPVGMRWRWTAGYFDRMQSLMLRNVERLDLKRSLPRELMLAVADLSPGTKDAMWSWADPVPFCRETGHMLRLFGRMILTAARRRVVPRNLQTQYGVFYRLVPQARSKYLMLRVKGALGLAAGSRAIPRTAAAEKANSILFVCYGNLMRSPMAEALLKRALAEHEDSEVVVRSAGLHAVPGREAHSWAIAASREFEISLDEHRAHAVTTELIAGSDLIFGMDYANLAELEALYPEARKKFLLLGSYASGNHSREIPDPYLGDLEKTRRCYALIKQCVDNLASSISFSQPGARVSCGTSREDGK